MNIRRLNDVLKIAGAFTAAIATLAPFLPPQYLGAFTHALAAVTTLIGSISGYAAGLGTRTPGTEYQDVADAKAVAKALTVPPPPLPSIVFTAKPDQTPTP